jgi:RNA polymerase sigma factor (sigma-70 family)
MTTAREEDLVELFDLAYRVAYRIVAQRQAAEDIAAEAVARAWDRWDQVHAYARPWVARVAANLALSEVRRLARPLRLLAPRLAPDQLDLVERLDLASALRRLSRRQREVVVLRFVADLPEAEVALLLGCSTGSVKTHASRGLASLRKHLTPREDPDARLA